jgi:hypothetical protein
LHPLVVIEIAFVNSGHDEDWNLDIFEMTSNINELAKELVN